MKRFTLLDDAHLLGRLHEEMGRLFSDVFQERGPWSARKFGDAFSERAFPPLNVWEDESQLYASCELPGVEMGNIEILVNGRELTISGERRPLDDEKYTFHRRERRDGSFHRVVHLSKDIDVENVSASLKDGVLTLTLPKAQAARARKVDVKCLES